MLNSIQGLSWLQRFAILALFSVLQCVTAQKIVESHDNIDFIAKDGTLLHSYKLIKFPYIEAFDKTMTLNGSFCYAESLTAYEANCKNQTKADSWIVANEFSSEFTNEIIKKTKENYTETLIDGLIIISD